MIYATHFSPLQTSKFESAASIGNDKSRKDPNKYDCKFSLRIRLGKAVEQLIWFQAGKLSDDELNKRIKIANEQTLGDRCTPTAPYFKLQPYEKKRVGNTNGEGRILCWLGGVGTKSGILCIVFRRLGFSYTIGVPQVYYIRSHSRLSIMCSCR